MYGTQQMGDFKHTENRKLSCICFVDWPEFQFSIFNKASKMVYAGTLKEICKFGVFL